MTFTIDKMASITMPNIRKSFRARWLIHVNKTHPDIVKNQPDYKNYAFYLFSINDLVSVQPKMSSEYLSNWTFTTNEIDFSNLYITPKRTFRQLWLNFAYTKYPDIVKKQLDYKRSFEYHVI